MEPLRSIKRNIGWFSFLLLAFLLLPLGELQAQQDKVAAFKQSLAQNQKRLAQYQWIETTTVSVKGDQKSQVQKQCSYGPDGKVQKQQISAPDDDQGSPGGVKGRVIAKKKAEMKDYMEQAAALVRMYVPPDPQLIQAAKDAGKLSFTPMGPGAAQLSFPNFVKAGDNMSLNIDLGSYALQAVSVKSYLDSPDDAIALQVTFASLNDGVSYPAQTVLDAPAKNIQVVVQNSNYQRMAAAAQPPQQPQEMQGGTAGQATLSPQQIDSLTAPIALYPDALIAQMLTASTNFFELQSFAGWLGKSTLMGSALQDAAQSAGYDACFVALAPFPQVVQMMAQKADWTKQLGQAFSANHGAVFDSIQRLRTQAQAAGNLKTTPQQEVVSQTTSSGQQVIVIEPVNPQVVYVPQYNPQVVYVQSTAPAAGAAVAFTAGVVIGAAASGHYYGPYAWHGAAMYNEAWDNRADYANQRQDAYQQNSSQRQSAAQSNQSQRQSASQTNQANRQSSAEGMQSNAQANQGQRQSSASAAQGGAAADSRAQGAGAGGGASSAESRGRSEGGGGGAGGREGGGGGAFSGYGGGGGERDASSRGRSSSGGGGGGRSGGGRRGR